CCTETSMASCIFPMSVQNRSPRLLIAFGLRKGRRCAALPVRNSSASLALRSSIEKEKKSRNIPTTPIISCHCSDKDGRSGKQLLPEGAGHDELHPYRSGARANFSSAVLATNSAIASDEVAAGEGALRM